MQTIKFEIGYPVYMCSTQVAKKEDYDLNKCDMEYEDTLSLTYKKALKRAVKFLKKHPYSYVDLHSYDTEDDCRGNIEDYIEVVNGVVYKNGHKLKQEWQDLFNA